MHKHICDKLIGSEIRRHKEMQAEETRQVCALPLHYNRSQEHENVYGQKILCYIG